MHWNCLALSLSLFLLFLIFNGGEFLEPFFLPIYRNPSIPYIVIQVIFSSMITQEWWLLSPALYWFVLSSGSTMAPTGWASHLHPLCSCGCCLLPFSASTISPSGTQEFTRLFRPTTFTSSSGTREKMDGSPLEEFFYVLLVTGSQNLLTSCSFSFTISGFM